MIILMRRPPGHEAPDVRLLLHEQRMRRRLLALRTRLADAIEARIALLDALDGDPDLEPSLGSLERHPNPYRSFGDPLTHQLDWGGQGEPDPDREQDGGDASESDECVPFGEPEPETVRVRRAQQAGRAA